MKSQKVVSVVMILTGVFWLGSIPVSAKTRVKTLQVKARNAVVSSQWLPVGDEPGHVIGMQAREGEAVFDNKETARYSTVSTFDSRRGKPGTSRGYSKFTFSDGSSITFSWTAEIWNQDGLSCNKGQGAIIKGTGRFTGITGTSAFTGKQLKPAAEDPARTVLQNAVIKYALP